MAPTPPSLLHGVNWASATIPGQACGFRRPIHLHHHHAFVRAIPRRYARYLSNQREIGLRRGVYVYGGWTRVRYGRLGDDGRDVAGLSVYCSNGGGTADGNFAYAWVIYGARGGRPSPLGIVTPHVKPLLHMLPTTLTISFDGGTIIAHEAWYGRKDGTCCPSGRARTTWTHSGGRLHAQPTVVIRQPKSA